MNKALTEYNGNIRIYIEMLIRDIKLILTITAVRDINSTLTLNPISFENKNLIHLKKQDVKMMI